MAVISFKKPSNFDQTTDKLAKKIIDKGSYRGKIINAKIYNDHFTNEDKYKITWQLSEGEISKNFRLWHPDQKIQEYQIRDLLNIFHILGVKTFDVDDQGELKLEIEDDILIGKENGLNVEHTVKSSGEVFAYVDSCFKLLDQNSDELTKLVEDSNDF